MRIGELSEKSGVSVATIKYYLREGLLPAGELSRPNQASYDDGHVERLRYIRALIDIGKLPITQVREVLAMVHSPSPNIHDALGTALQASVTVRGTASPEAQKEIDELVVRRKWQVSPNAPGRRAAAEVITALRQLGADDLVDLLDEYAKAVERIARLDLRFVRERSSPEAMVNGAVIGTLLGDSLIAALRRLADEHVSAEAFQT
jgi:DNA-binding transcriptional MerR regulator